MRVLVAGGAGFIGSHIVDELLRLGHEPSVVDDLSTGRRTNLPAGVPCHQVDVRDKSALAQVFDKVRPEWICHQAAQMSVSRSVREPSFDADVNIMGLLNVLDLAVTHGVKRVAWASSGGVLYGNVFEPAPEETPANPISPYGIAKLVGEKYLRFYAEQHGFQAVALRYANVYGPRQNPEGEAGVVAIFTTRMLAAEPTTINGDGSIIRDYVYVGDVARANVSALTRDLGAAFTPVNIGTGVGTDLIQLSSHLRALCGESRAARGLSSDVPSPKHGPPRAGDLQSNLVDARFAKQALDWQPTTPLKDGLQNTVEWFASSER